MKYRKTVKRRQRGGTQHPGKIYIFYHIFCNENTGHIVKDQCLRIIFSNLYKRVDAIHCFLTGDPTEINEIKTLLGQMGNKFLISAEGPGDTSYERFTLLKIDDYIKPEDNFLYIHSKGVKTRITGEEDTLNNSIYLWRTWMEYYLMAQHNECLDKLNTHDIVGVNFSNQKIGNHFSGNFWWSTGKYYKTLPKEIGPHYNDPEIFVFSNPAVKYYEIGKIHTEMNDGLYYKFVYPTDYIDKV